MTSVVWKFYLFFTRYEASDDIFNVYVSYVLPGLSVLLLVCIVCGCYDLSPRPTKLSSNA